jgi:hypothetical protein
MTSVGCWSGSGLRPFHRNPGTLRIFSVHRPVRVVGVDEQGGSVGNHRGPPARAWFTVEAGELTSEAAHASRSAERDLGRGTPD